MVIYTVGIEGGQCQATLWIPWILVLLFTFVDYFTKTIRTFRHPFLTERVMCNAQTVTCPTTTTIQALISRVTHCGWYSMHKQLPCTSPGQYPSILTFSKFLHYLSSMYVQWRKHILIAIGIAFISYSCKPYRWVAGGCPAASLKRALVL